MTAHFRAVLVRSIARFVVRIASGNNGPPTNVANVLVRFVHSAVSMSVKDVVTSTPSREDYSDFARTASLFTRRSTTGRQALSFIIRTKGGLIRVATNGVELG